MPKKRSWMSCVGLAVIVMAAMSSIGCNAAWTTPERYEKGLIVVLPGIEGMGPLNLSICDGLFNGGVEGAIELTGWGGGPLGILFNQRAEAGNRRRAAGIAKRIVAYQNEYPDRPVFLIGHSGGTAIAVWTAEAMPNDHQVTGLILLASSLSGEYNLCPALERTTQGIVNFYSGNDTILLALGTGAVGTMDGRYSAPAGRIGFETPEILGDSWAYEGLHNVAWTPRMTRLNHIGGHSGYSGYTFVEAVVAELVKDPVWSEQSIELVIADAVARKTPPPTVAAAEPADDEAADEAEAQTVAAVADAATESADETEIETSAAMSVEEEVAEAAEEVATADEPEDEPAEESQAVSEQAAEVGADTLVLPAVEQQVAPPAGDADES